jgi:glycosyltransferase involved in cell wall biosynthesis
MKIAQVSATFPPYMAGTGNVCYNYSIGLSKLGHDVTVYTSKCSNNDYSYPDCFKIKNYRPIIKLGNAPFIPQLLKIRDYDLIHLHYPFFFGGELIYLLKKLKNEKYIITYHNDAISSDFRNIFFKIHAKTFSDIIIKNASKVTVLSEDYSKYSKLANTFSRKREDIIVLPNGVDIKKFCPNNRYPENFSKNTDLLLFVGALDNAHRFKGLEYLLKACQVLKGENCKFSLLVVGDGELKGYYERLAREYHILDYVQFLGRIESNLLPNIYSLADILVLPSTGVENFPLVVLEAMATGKPIILSELPGVRTIIENGKEGLFIKPADFRDLADKLRYLLNNPSVRKKFGENGRIKVENNYSWEIIIQKLASIYKDVL